MGRLPRNRAACGQDRPEALPPFRHVEYDAMRAAMDDLAHVGRQVNVQGSYPVAIT